MADAGVEVGTHNGTNTFISFKRIAGMQLLWQIEVAKSRTECE